jgi:hypothetical protein
MSTRSNIGIERDGGKVEAIYCHSDGYLDWNGRILDEHYRDREKVEALVALGDISSLHPEIGEKHPWDALESGVVRAYHRDRGEAWKDVKPRTFETRAAWLKAGGIDIEYFYLFTLAGEWVWKHYRRTPDFAPLAGAVEPEDESEDAEEAV